MKFEDLKSQEDLDNLINSRVEKAVGKGGEDLAALRAQVETLLTEKKAEADKRKAAEEAAKAKEVEALKNAGKIEEVENAIREQYEGKSKEQAELIESLRGQILGGKKDTILESLAGSFVSADAAKLMLNGLVDVTTSDDGIVTNFMGVDGKVVTTDQKEFIKYLSGQDAFKSVLKGANSSGGGAPGGKGNTGGAGGSDDSVQGRLSQRLAEKGLIKSR